MWLAISLRREARTKPPMPAPTMMKSNSTILLTVLNEVEVYLSPSQVCKAFVGGVLIMTIHS